MNEMVDEMGTGYYEHKIEVKYTEGLLDASKDWQWFIEYTEGNFEPDESFSVFADFQRCFSKIHLVFVHLSRIVDMAGDISVRIEEDWLKNVYGCVRIRCGLADVETMLKGDGFYDVLAVASYATRLINCVSDAQYLFNPQLLYVCNLSELFDFEPLGDTRDKLIELVGSIKVDGFEKAAETLRLNFASEIKEVDEQYVSHCLDEYFDEDFLSFKHVEGEPFRTWEESFLCDAFGTSFSNGSVEPAIRFRNGAEEPNTDLWSLEYLNKAKSAIRDERATCIIETLEYAKHGILPSARTQMILVDLSIKRAKEAISTNSEIWRLDCTALRIVLQLIDDKMLGSEPKARFFKNVGGILSTIDDYRDIRFIRSRGLPLTKRQKDLFVEKTKSIAKDSLNAVLTQHDLIQVFKNPEIARSCEGADLEKAFQLFSQHIESIDATTSELFYWAMQFYIEALGNPLVDNKWVKQVLIGLRHMWQEGYYKQVVSSMQVFSHEQSVNKDDVRGLNVGFLATPHAFAQSLILQSDESILETLESMAEHALVFAFNKTTISEYYPEHIHVALDGGPKSIDRMIVDELMRIYEDNSYRFLNQLSEQNVADGYFERVGQGIQIISNMIDIRPVYESLASNLPEPYELLPYPETGPTLGHLTQLFPILENLIRMNGEIFSIVPFQIEAKNYTRLREVSGVLAEIVSELKSITGTIQGCNDFLFVHYVMYSPNGFNIRNECIHGRQYQGSSGVVGAFRLTVICTYMMLKRWIALLSITAEQDDGPDQIRPKA